MAKISDQENARKSTYPIQSLILNRWSPRAMSGQPMSDEELMPLFEAARWAPSSFNSQPWRFIYAKRDTPNWGPLFDLLLEVNKQWCCNAAVLVLIISQKLFESNGKPSVTHSFATGSAWENLCLEGAARHYVVHGMAGFDYEKARKVCQVPDDYQVEAMTAIGKKGNLAALPEEMRKKEQPSQRKPLREIIFEGQFAPSFAKKKNASS
ncbi:MAG: nitroreductase family protein [Chlamydiota bacterium]